MPGIGLRGDWTVRRAMALSVAREEAVGARASELTELDGVPVCLLFQVCGGYLEHFGKLLANCQNGCQGAIRLAII